MPIKEYTCNDCKEKFEILTLSQGEQKRLEQSGIECKKCQSKNIEPVQVSRNTGFSLKGGGWYKSNYD